MSVSHAQQDEYKMYFCKDSKLTWTAVFIQLLWVWDRRNLKLKASLEMKQNLLSEKQKKGNPLSLWTCQGLGFHSARSTRSLPGPSQYPGWGTGAISSIQVSIIVTDRNWWVCHLSEWRPAALKPSVGWEMGKEWLVLVHKLYQVVSHWDMGIGTIWNLVSSPWPLTLGSRINSLMPSRVRTTFWVGQGHHWVILQGSLWIWGTNCSVFWLLDLLARWIMRRLNQPCYWVSDHSAPSIHMIKALRCFYRQGSIGSSGHSRDLSSSILTPALFAETLCLEAAGPCHEERAYLSPCACLPSMAMKSAQSNELPVNTLRTERTTANTVRTTSTRRDENTLSVQLVDGSFRSISPGFKSYPQHSVYKCCLREINFLSVSGCTFKDDSSHYTELLREIVWKTLNVHWGVARLSHHLQAPLQQAITLEHRNLSLCPQLLISTDVWSWISSLLDLILRPAAPHICFHQGLYSQTGSLENPS